MKKLYEFTANLKCAVVVAAESEEEARAAIETWETSWVDSGDLLEVSDVDLLVVREAKASDLSDEAHVVVN